MQESAEHRQRKILIVDSVDESRQRLADIFQPRSCEKISRFQVFEARSGDEGLALFQDLHPDLMLIHVNVKGMSGGDVCRAVRSAEVDRHTGIIFLAQDDSEYNALAVVCLDLGADDFLQAECRSAELRARVKTVLRMKAMTDELRRANHQLRKLSTTDDLTGLANMRGFNSRFLDAVHRCRIGHGGLGVIMIDLDHFKHVNDTVNHLMGSFVLREIGRLIRMSGLLSSTDIAARYGGDEFIIAVAADDLETVTRKAESIRRLIGSHRFEKEGFVPTVKASVGVAWAPPAFKGRPEDVVKLADMMLYRSKECGRDRVTAEVLRYPIDLFCRATTMLAREYRFTEEVECRGRRVGLGS